MTEFTEIRLNPAISYDAESSSEWFTIITELDGGDEDRDRRRAHPRAEYVISYDARKPEVIEILGGVHKAMAGRHIGFRMKDHADFRSSFGGKPISATDQVIGTGDGVETVFQLSKTYQSGHRFYTRPIYKPRPSPQPLVAVDGVAITGWTLDLRDGTVTFDVAPAIGEVVTAGFEFDVPVRFESDKFTVRLLSAGANGARGVRLIEDPRWRSIPGEATWLFSDLTGSGTGEDPLETLVNVTLVEALA